jgi:hypothetical protein
VRNVHVGVRKQHGDGAVAFLGLVKRWFAVLRHWDPNFYRMSLKRIYFYTVGLGKKDF